MNIIPTFAGSGHHGFIGGSLKDLTNTLVGSGRALKVLVLNVKLLAHGLALLDSHESLGDLLQLLNIHSLGVEAQILLAANKDNR